LLIRSSSIASHVENDILQACCLRHLPVDACTSAERHGCCVENKITDLAEKVVLFRNQLLFAITHSE
jgi:hypothetical protein